MVKRILYRVCHGTEDPDQFYKDLLTFRPAILHGFKRHKVRYCDYPAIIPHSMSNAKNNDASGDQPLPSVRGTLVTGLSDGDIYRLNTFEGSQYERIKVSVNPLTSVGDAEGKGNVEGEAVQAEVYVWVEGRDSLEDEEWDFATFMREKVQNWVGGSHEEEYAGMALCNRMLWMQLFILLVL